MRAKFGSDPTAGSKNFSFKFISRLDIVTPRCLAESVIGKGWSWRVYVLRILCLLRPTCIV